MGCTEQWTKWTRDPAPFSSGPKHREGAGSPGCLRRVLGVYTTRILARGVAGAISSGNIIKAMSLGTEELRLRLKVGAR